MVLSIGIVKIVQTKNRKYEKIEKKLILGSVGERWWDGIIWISSIACGEVKIKIWERSEEQVASY